jgi:gliding motility-associated-like protein
MRATFLLLLFLAGHQVTAQTNWARRLGAWSNDAYNSIVIDAAGNNYVAGEFGGTIATPIGTIGSQGSLDMVIAKYDPSGTLLWIRTFGGPGLDRAIDIALGPSGELLIVGTYMNTVQFGNTTATSNGNTQDIFILKMSSADGSLDWVRTGGSSNGVDQPNSVSIAADGNIAVGGEFRGTAVFDAGTLVSMIDPDNGDHSVDIFLLSYDTDGNALWMQHGAAEFADRGMAVEHDPAGNVYLTGQFSDTLTFDQTHFNQMFSAIFIARFDPGGAEEWFRVFGGGTYNQVFDMVLVETDRLMLTGDIQGTVIFLDNDPNLFTAVAPRSSFLVEIDLAGELLRQTTWGSDHVVNTRSLSVQGDEISVLGRFQCQFTDFSALHGTGTWMATGLHDLYVARFHLSTLLLKDSQQFGGQKNKVPGGIAHAPDGSSIFCGSFDRILIFPSVPNTFSAIPEPQYLLTADAPQGFCTDASYTSYTGLNGSALMDGFIARGFTVGRQPYDLWLRNDPLCERPQRDVFIRMNNLGVTGLDTLTHCGPTPLSLFTNTAYTPDTSLRHNAPDMLFLWNTGDTTSYITAGSTGWYSCTVNSAAGCWSRTDSLYMIIHPIPPKPLVSDDVVVNTAADYPALIDVCEPQIPLLWVTGVDPANTVHWTGPNLYIQNDSINATVTGTYTAHVTTPMGCTNITNVQVIIHLNVPLASYEAEYFVHFPQDLDQNDTLEICSNASVQYSANVSFLLNNVPASLPPGILMFRQCNGYGWNLVNSPPMASCSQLITTEGWHQFTIDVMLTNAPCGVDTLVFTRTDSLYVIPFPVTYPTVSIFAPDYICPGDTVPVTATCTACDIITWNGANIVASNDSMAWIASQGTISINVTHVDTNNCTTSASASDHVPWNPKPLLSSMPTDGIICPDSVAIIFADHEGLSYQWYGPLGPMNVDNDTIVTSQPGLYYLEMVDLLGCFVTSDPFLITDYATPFLNILPDNSICTPSETATLQVVTTSISTVQWQSPLNGNALEQVITEPGIYSCTVNGCGVTTLLSVEIFGNNAVADIQQEGPFLICPDDEILLTATPGMVLYYWEPGSVIGTDLLVQNAGTYTLFATDVHGCSDTMQVHVQEIPWTNTLQWSDTTICPGTPLVLSVSGSGAVYWFADAALTDTIGMGNIIDLGSPLEQTTIYVQQIEGQCASAAHEVNIDMLSIAPFVSGPDTACIGVEVILQVPDDPGTTVSWETPTGTYTGSTLIISAAAPIDEGEYIVTSTNAFCSTSLTHHLTVVAPIPFELGPDAVICDGAEVLVEVPAGYSDPLWQDGSTGPDFMATGAGWIELEATDVNGCINSDSLYVSIFNFSIALSADAVTICAGDDAVFTAIGSGTIQWFSDPALQQSINTGNSITLISPSNSMTVYVIQEEGGCISEVLGVTLMVDPVPEGITMDPPALVCLGQPFTIATSAIGGQWETPIGSFSGTTFTSTAADTMDSGTYTFTSFIGNCPGEPLSTTITVLIPEIIPMSPDTSFCNGSEFTLSIPEWLTDPVWSTGNTTYGIVVIDAGTYSVTATDTQGCPTTGSTELTIIDCALVVPNVFTPNGDGVNDTWELPPGPFRSTSFTVYNRWGQLVWDGDVMRQSFNGKHYKNGEPLPEGTYYYVLGLQTSRGERSERTGYLEVMK